MPAAVSHGSAGTAPAAAAQMARRLRRRRRHPRGGGARSPPASRSTTTCITPGDATPVAQFIEVPAADNHPLTGKILLTDVFVTQLNALNYLQYRFFDSDSEVVSGPELLGPTPNESQYLAQGYLQMAQAQSFATAAALTHLGYTVTSTNAGALIYGIEPHSPAAGDAARGAGDHRGERHPDDDRVLPRRLAARLDAGLERGAQGRGVLHQRCRPVRPRTHRDQVGDARHTAQGTGRDRLRAADQADGVPRHRPADAAGLALPRARSRCTPRTSADRRPAWP